MFSKMFFRPKGPNAIFSEEKFSEGKSFGALRACPVLVGVGLAATGLLGCGMGPVPTSMVVTQVAPQSQPTELVAAPETSDSNDQAVAGDLALHSYEDCVAAGNMTTRSIPPRCVTKGGKSFVRGKDSLRVTKPQGAQTVVGANPAAANQSTIDTFEDCVAAGFAIRRTLPPSCADGKGRVFTEGILGVARYEGSSGAQAEAGGKLCKDNCGDGSCQEIVCMALGCPCPETADSCPSDCSGD